VVGWLLFFSIGKEKVTVYVKQTYNILYEVF